jgi:hypothetical protein
MKALYPTATLPHSAACSGHFFFLPAFSAETRPTLRRLFAGPARVHVRVR